VAKQGSSGRVAADTGLQPSRSTVRARASVIVGELRGFSRLAGKVDRDVSVALLEEFLRATSDVAVAEGAAIDRIVGDVFVLVFRRNTPWRMDCASAVRTGLALQRAFLAMRNRWRRDDVLEGGQLSLALGVASGPLVLAELEGVPGVHSVPFGEALSRASQLCAGARAADVLIDEATYIGARRLLDREVTFTSRELGGRTKDAVTAYRAQQRRAGLQVVSRRVATDPVCGVTVSLDRATCHLDYGGAVFHFCSRECADRFASDPPSWVEEG